MANSSVSGGLKFESSNQPGSLETCVALSSYATALYIGDAVKMGTGGGSKAIGAYTGQVVEACGNTGAIYGVVEGFLPQATSGTSAINFNQRYGAASTDRLVVVRRAQPSDVYSIMDDGTLASGARSALGVGNIGLNANLNVSTAGSTTTGMSNMQLAGSTAATTATLQLKIIGLYPTPDNDGSSANARWLVSINNAQTNTGGTGTAGV